MKAINMIKEFFAIFKTKSLTQSQIDEKRKIIEEKKGVGFKGAYMLVNVKSGYENSCIGNYPSIEMYPVHGNKTGSSNLYISRIQKNQNENNSN